MCLVAAPTLAWTGRRLTFQRRLLTLWAWLMVFPNCGPLPQISQTRAINPGSFQAVAEALILQETSGFGQKRSCRLPDLQTPARTAACYNFAHANFHAIPGLAHRHRSNRDTA